MARQRDIIAGAVGVHSGVRPVEQGEGDSVVAVFERASDALAAAVEAQLAIAAEPWAGQAMRVRMGVRTGEAEFLDDRTYGGAAIIRCARIRDLAQGGQVLVSAATVEVAGDRLPPGSSPVPVGSATLRGLTHRPALDGLATRMEKGRPGGTAASSDSSTTASSTMECSSLSQNTSQAQQGCLVAVVTGADGSFAAYRRCSNDACRDAW